MKNKDKKGITLIALVITIIVLLIISGVVLVTLTNEDKNIVEQSKEVRTNTEIIQEEEILKNILIEVQNKKFQGEILKNKKEYIEKALTEEGITNFEVTNNSVIIKAREYIYSELIPGYTL